MRRLSRFALIVLSSAWFQPAPATDEPVIAVAANLAPAAERLAAEFKKETGLGVRLSFGSSGNFTKQITEGAPYELFLSADEEYVLRLHAQGFTDDAGFVYAVGRLVFFLPAHSPLADADALETLTAALQAPPPGRIAIANPELAPYGRAARGVLMHLKLWDKIQDRLLLGENVMQAAQFAFAGDVSFALLPLSLARLPELSGQGRHLLIPADWHVSIRQRTVLLKGAGHTARRFYEFLLGEQATRLLRDYGYDVPDHR
jgi:molybdate transport system substrate-binding protein